MIDAGALAVVGTHPHVLQPWQKLRSAKGHEALALYSLGNFVSNQKALRHGGDNAATIILYLGIVKEGSGKASISG